MEKAAPQKRRFWKTGRVWEDSHTHTLPACSLEMGFGVTVSWLGHAVKCNILLGGGFCGIQWFLMSYTSLTDSHKRKGRHLENSRQERWDPGKTLRRGEAGDNRGPESRSSITSTAGLQSDSGEAALNRPDSTVRCPGLCTATMGSWPEIQDCQKKMEMCKEILHMKMTKNKEGWWKLLHGRADENKERWS